MKYSVCITYYFSRSNINFLLKEIDKYKSNKIEILIRNDNPNTALKIPRKKKNIKIYNAKETSIGEIESIKFLIKKSKGNYVVIVADDDLISHKVFDTIDKVEKLKKFESFLFLSTTKKKFFKKEKSFKTSNKLSLLEEFFKNNIHLSGTVGTVFRKKFLISYLKNIKLVKYNFDIYLLMIMIFSSKIFISKKIYGFNNVSTSKISSKSIEVNKYINDVKQLSKFLEKKNNTRIYYLFSSFYIKNFYSIMFRKGSNINFNQSMNFYSIFLGSKNVSLNVKIYYKIFLNLAKTFLKKILIFINN